MNMIFFFLFILLCTAGMVITLDIAKEEKSRLYAAICLLFTFCAFVSSTFLFLEILAYVKEAFY